MNWYISYIFIKKDKNLDKDERDMLCYYLSKYFYEGVVSVTDKEVGEIVDLHRTNVQKKRKHLEELGYIKCKSNGKGVKIAFNNYIISKAEEEKKEKKV